MLDSGGNNWGAAAEPAVATKTVLVIENDRELRECMQHVLEDEGFVTLAAEQGLTALDLLRGEGRLPDVIVLDMMMPIMNGWDFLHRLHQDRRFVAIPVIVLTGMADHVNGDRVSRSLRKPINLDDLLDAVRNAR